MSVYKNILKPLAWWVLVIVVLIIGIWLCFLAYYAWPIAMDSVGELPDLP